MSKGVRRGLTVVVERGGYVLLPEGVRKTLGVIPGDPLLMRGDPDAKGIVLSRVTTPHHLRPTRYGHLRSARILVGPGHVADSAKA